MKKQEAQKSVSIKANFNLKIIKSVINYFKENKIDIDSLKKDHKEFIKKQ